MFRAAQALAATAAIGLVFTGLRTVTAQDPTAELKPMKVEDGDSALRKLLKERYNTAVEEVQTASSLFRTGHSPFDGVSAALARLAKAGVELAQSPAERIECLQRVVSQAKATESLATAKYQAAEATMQAVLQARGARLDAEIALLREREAAK